MAKKLPVEKFNRKVLVKKDDAVADPKLGCRPENRTTEQIINYGVVVIDKPTGPTSHQTAEFVQKILNINKSGHSGTLDPGVHGLLPVALGKATRTVQLLLKSGKEYIGIAHFHQEVKLETIQDCINQHFTGKISQLPPIKSAVKRQTRQREIYYFELLELDGQDLLFRVGCEAGTYIRKLIHDLGQKLKVGAHMQELRRTKAGPYTEAQMTTLQDLKDAYHYYKEENNDKFLRKLILPVETVTEGAPKVWVYDSAIPSLCHGAPLNAPGIVKLHSAIKQNEQVAVMSMKDELVGFGIAKMATSEMMQQERGLAVQMDAIFMERTLYGSK